MVPDAVSKRGAPAENTDHLLLEQGPGMGQGWEQGSEVPSCPLACECQGSKGVLQHHYHLETVVARVRLYLYPHYVLVFETG